MREWVEPPEVEVAPELQRVVGGHPLVAQALARRGLASVEAARAFLDPDDYRPAPSSELPDLDKAVERLERAIRAGERICVWGDFDADGQTATALLVSTLRDLGAAVQYHIPHRQKESHGVNLPVLQEIVAAGAGLVLTCDTGVTAHEAIAYARSRGVDVIVTDHHDLPAALPDACAVVDPKRLLETHPLRELPGVGCAYKLAEALYERAGRPGDAAQHLDLAALGIVADVAVQTGDTRYLLQRGLDALRHTQRLGLQALIEIAELTSDWLTEEHVGFELAPRLNALGRLDDANVAVEFLTTDDLTRARILANEMDGLNARRRLLVNQVLQAAQAQIEREPALLDHAALVLSHPAWPSGIIGIVAGRLAERYGRPTVLIATPPGEPGRGSARSVEGCNVTAALAANRDLLHRFGGHPMAAGLAIDPERIPEFRRALSRTVLETCGAMPRKAALQVDGYLPLSDLSLELVEQVERLAPFGRGNPPLTLASRGLALVSRTGVGRTGEHLQLIVADEGGASRKVVWWQGGSEPPPPERFDLAYVVRASNYRGQRDVQIEWVDARPIEQPAVTLHAGAPPIEIVDHRRDPAPRRVLRQLQGQPGVQVWSEAEARAEVAGLDRYELGAAESLVIWTTPPGPAELRAVLERVTPARVYLFGVDPGLDEPNKFLKRLAGLAKRTLSSNQGCVRISTLAAATAQREVTVRAGLAWLAARGHLVVSEAGGDKVQLVAGDQAAGADLSQAAARLKDLLEETAAYRAHFARAEKETLVSFQSTTLD